MRGVAQVGLVLGGGGLVGHAYHAGTLRALADLGWDARDAAVIVGTSAGSGVGALLRAGLPPRDLAARVLGEPLTSEGARVVAKAPRPTTSLPPLTAMGGVRRPASPELLARSAMRWWRARPGHFVAAGLPEGGQPTTMIGDRVRAIYDGLGRWPDKPLWICALRLSDGERAVFGRDPLPQTDVATAVEASSAIPGMFAPVTIDGRRYVDGGAHSPTNADLLSGLGLDVIIVISPMSLRAGSALRATNATRFWWHRQLGQELARARRAGARILVFEPTPDDLAAMGLSTEALDGRRMPDVTRQAERSAAAVLLEEPPLD
jgi:NTE family protein